MDNWRASTEASALHRNGNSTKHNPRRNTSIQYASDVVVVTCGASRSTGTQRSGWVARTRSGRLRNLSSARTCGHEFFIQHRIPIDLTRPPCCCNPMSRAPFGAPLLRAHRTWSASNMERTISVGSPIKFHRYAVTNVLRYRYFTYQLKMQR